MNDDLLLKLYQKYNLSSKGSFETFKNDMQFESTAKKFYDNYGLSKSGSFDTFRSDLGIGTTFDFDTNKNVPGANKDAGFRNNNPLNLRPFNSSQPSKNNFRVFNTLEEGYQAAERDIRFKISGKSNAFNGNLRKSGKNLQNATIQDLILTWAPRTENNAAALENYFSSVGKHLGVDVKKTHPSQVNIKDLVIAMSKVESPISYNSMMRSRQGSQQPQGGAGVQAPIQQPSTSKEKVLSDLELKIKNSVEKSRKTSGTTARDYYAVGEKLPDIKSVSRKVYDDAFKSGLLNINDFTTEELNKLYKQDDYVAQKRKEANESKKYLQEQLKDEGFFESAGDYLAGTALDGLLPSQALDTKDGKINIRYKKGMAGRVDVTDNFDMYLTPEQIMELKYHPGDKSGDPNSQRNKYLRTIQGVIAAGEKAEFEAESLGIDKRLGLINGRLENLKTNLETRFYKGVLDDISSINQKVQEGTATPEEQAKLQKYLPQLQQSGELEEISKLSQVYNDDIGKITSLEGRLGTLKKLRALENIRTSENESRKRKMSGLARTVEGLIGIGTSTIDKLIKMPKDVALLTGTLAETVTGQDINAFDEISKSALVTPDRIKTSKETRSAFDRFVKVGNNEVVFKDGKADKVYDSEGYEISDPLLKSKYLRKGQLLYNEDPDKLDWAMRTDGLVYGLEETAPDLINIFLTGNVIKSVGKSALKNLAAGTATGSKPAGLLGRLKNISATVAESPRLLESIPMIPVFSGQMMQEAIKEGKVATPGELFAATSAKLAEEAFAEMLFAGPLGKTLSGEGLTPSIFKNLTRGKISDLYQNIASGKIKAGDYAREIAKVGKELVKDTGFEGLEEAVVEIMDPMVNEVLNHTLETSYEDEPFDWGDVISSFGVGAIAGGAMGAMRSTGSVLNIKKSAQQHYKDLIAAVTNNNLDSQIQNTTVKNPEAFRIHSQTLLDRGDITKDQFEQVVGAVEEASKRSERLIEPKKRTGLLSVLNDDTDLNEGFNNVYRNVAYSAAMSKLDKSENPETQAKNKQKTQDYENILDELDINQANNIFSVTTPSSIEDVKGYNNAQFAELKDRHKQISETVGNTKYSNETKAKIYEIRLKQEAKKISLDKEGITQKAKEKIQKELDELLAQEKEVKSVDQKIDEQMQEEEKKQEIIDELKNGSSDLSDPQTGEVLNELLSSLQLRLVEENIPLDDTEAIEALKSEYEEVPGATDLIDRHFNGKNLQSSKVKEEKYNESEIDWARVTLGYTESVSEKYKDSEGNVDQDQMDKDQSAIDELYKEQVTAEQQSQPDYNPEAALAQTNDYLSQKTFEEKLATDSLYREIAKQYFDGKKTKGFQPVETTSKNVSSSEKLSSLRSELKSTIDKNLDKLKGYKDEKISIIDIVKSFAFKQIDGYNIDESEKELLRQYVHEYTDPLTDTNSDQKVSPENSNGNIQIRNIGYISTIGGTPFYTIEVYDKDGNSLGKKSVPKNIVESKEFFNKELMLDGYELGVSYRIVPFQQPLNDTLKDQNEAALTLKIGDQVYYEIDPNSNWNSPTSTIRSIPLDAGNVEIAIVVYQKDGIAVDKNTPGATRKVVGILPALNASLPQHVQGTISSLRSILWNDNTATVTTKVNNVTSLTNYEVGTTREVTLDDLTLTSLDEEGNNGLFIVAVPWADGVENSSDNNINNAILINGDKSFIPKRTIPKSWLGRLIIKINGNHYKLTTKKIKDVPNARKELREGLLKITQGVTPEDRKKEWFKLLGLGENTVGIIRYRTNETKLDKDGNVVPVSTIDYENNDGKTKNKMGGLAPVLIYSPETKIFQYDGVKYPILSEEDFEKLLDQIGERSVHIDHAILNERNYLKTITQYLETDLAPLQGDATDYRIVPTVYVDNNFEVTSSTKTGPVVVNQTTPVTPTTTEVTTDIEAIKSSINNLRSQLEGKQIELEKLELAAELNEDPYSNRNIYIVNNLPKITPESAEKETGTKIGTGKDINPSFLSKSGVSVERAAEIIVADGESEGIKLEEDFVRNEIINILQIGKNEYKKRNGKVNKEDIKRLREEINELSAKYDEELNKLKQQSTLPATEGGVPSSPSTSVDPIVNEILDKLKLLNQKKLIVDPTNNKKYIEVDENGNRIGDQTWDRASSIGGEKEFKNQEAADRGTIIDTLLRKMVSEEITSYEQFVNEYNKTNKGESDPFNEIFLKDLYSNFNVIKEQTKDFVLISSIPTLWGNINNKEYAGTIDLLAINKNTGKVYIIDLKTSTQNRRDKNGKYYESYKKSDSEQQSAYAELLAQRTGIVVSGITLLPVQVTKSRTTGEYASAKINYDGNNITLAAVVDETIFKTKSPEVVKQKEQELDNFKLQEEVKNLIDEIESTPKTVGRNQLINPKFLELIKKYRELTGQSYSQTKLKISTPEVKQNPNNKEFALAWLRERFDELDNISIDDEAIEKLYDIFNIGGGTILGAFRNASILLSSYATEQTARHEAFHAVFNLFLNDKQREQVLDEAFARFGKELGIYKKDYELAKQQGKAVDALFKIEDNINYQLKAVNILSSDKAKQVFDKGSKNKWSLDKILTELQIPRDQKQLILDSGLTNREDIITDLLANYSYTVEINTAKTNRIDNRNYNDPDNYDYYYETPPNERGEITDTEQNTNYYSNLTVPGGTNYTENEIATPVITPAIKGHAQFATDKGIGWFRSDESGYKTDIGKPTNINQIRESFDIGAAYYWKLDDTEWGVRPEGQNDSYGEYFITADEALETYNKNVYLKPKKVKTRRILEVQSDLFQKGRDKKFLELDAQRKIEDIENSYAEQAYEENKELQKFNENIYNKLISKIDQSKNQFLQLLNKDNNWVTFFVKSIIQDSAKKGYEKVLFPTGNTASKVEGHTTLEEFKKQKEDRIKELESKNNDLKSKENQQKYIDYLFDTDQLQEYPKSEEDIKYLIDSANSKRQNEINQLKKELERVETEGFGALKPIYNFYENTVANVLKKQGYSPKVITDEYGNSWYEISIDSKRDISPILLKTSEQAYYRSQGPLIMLEEKLADLFEDYKAELSLFSEKNKAKFPTITKFFDKLYNFLFKKFNILQSYLTDKVTINSLFYQLENNILGRDFLGRRKKSMQELFKRNVDSLKDNPYFKISNWNSAEVNRYADFINKDLFNSHLHSYGNSEQYNTVGLFEPTLSDLLERGVPVSDIISTFRTNIDSIIESWSLIYPDANFNLLLDIANQFKNNLDFQRIQLAKFNNQYGFNVTLKEDSSDEEADGTMNDDEVVQADGWMIENFKTSPKERLSKKLREFLTNLPVRSNDQISKNSDTYQTEYHDFEKINNKLLSELSDSTDLEDFLNRLNGLRSRFYWMDDIYYKIYGDTLYNERLNNGTLDFTIEDFKNLDSFENGTILYSLWSKIADLRNVNFITLLYDGSNYSQINTNTKNIIKSLKDRAINFVTNNFFRGGTYIFNIPVFEEIVISATNGDVRSFMELLNILGFNVDTQVVENIVSNPEQYKKALEALIVTRNNIVLNLDINKKDSKLSYKYKNNAGKYKPTSEPMEILAAIVASNDLTAEQRTILTVKGEKKYNHVLNNYLTRQFNKIKKDVKSWVKSKTLINNKKVLFHNALDWYNDLINDVDSFDIQYLDGVNEKDKSAYSGKEYSDMTLRDIKALNFNAFISSQGLLKDFRAYFSSTVFSDGKSKAFLNQKVYDTDINSKRENVHSKFANIALAELLRIKYLKENTTRFGYLNKNGIKFSILTFLNDHPQINLNNIDSYLVNNNGKVYLSQKAQSIIESIVDDHLASEFELYLDSMQENNLLNYADSKVFLTPDSILDSRVNKDSLKTYFYNQYYYNAIFQSVFSNDPSFYKSTVIEVQKRNKQLDSPSEYGVFEKANFSALILKDEEIPSDEQTINAIKALNYHPDVEKELLKKYEKNNTTDAGTYHSLSRRKDIMKAYNEWIESVHGPMFERLENGTATAEDLQFAMQPIKPFYFGNILVSDEFQQASIVAPVQLKNSEHLLVPQIAFLLKDGKVSIPSYSLENAEIEDFSNYRFPKLAKMLYTMNRHDVDTVLFESAVKASNFNFLDFNNVNDSSVALNRVELPNEYWGKQVSLPAKHEDNRIFFASQYRKVIIGDIDPNLIFSYNAEDSRDFEDIEKFVDSLPYQESTLTKSELINLLKKKNYSENDFKDLFELTLALDLSESLLDVNESISNPKKFYNKLRDRALKDTPSYHVAEAMEYQEDGKILQPLEIQGSVNEALSNAEYKKVSKIKTPGLALVNAPGFGVTDELKIKYKEDADGNPTGEIEYLEAFLPSFTKHLEVYANEEGIIDPKDPRIPEDALKMILYRVPLEGKYSIFPVKVVGFTPKAMGGIVMLPREATNISGFDFDADKLYGFVKKMRNVYGKDFLEYFKNSFNNKYNQTYSNEDIQILLDDYAFSDEYDFEDFWGIPLMEIMELYKDARMNSPVVVTGAKVIPSGLKTADERANLRVDMSFSVAGTKRFASDFFKGGSKKILEDEVEAIKETESQLEGKSEYEFNIANPNVQEDIAARNQIGKRLIGIFANANAFYNLIQGRSNLTLSKDFYIYGKRYSSLSLREELHVDNPRTISENLNTLLFASSEDTKSPVLAPLNINELTSNMLITMLMMGMPMKDALKFLRSEIMVKLINYSKNSNINDLNIAFNGFIEKNKDLYVKGDKLAPEASIVGRLLSISSVIKELSTGLKVDTGNIGPSLADVELSLLKIKNLQKHIHTRYPVILGLESIIPNIDTDNGKYVLFGKSNIIQLNAFANVLISELNNLSKYYSYLNQFFTSIKSEVNDIARTSNISPRELRVKDLHKINMEIYNSMIQKHFNEVVKNGENIFDIYNLYESFPNEFLESRLLNRPKYRDLKNLFDPQKQPNGLPVLVADTTGLSKLQSDKLKDLFAELLSENQKANNYVGVKLALYATILGYSYSKYSFAHLVPPSFYSTQYGKKIRNIVNGTTAANGFIDEIVFNIVKNNFTRLLNKSDLKDFNVLEDGTLEVKEDSNQNLQALPYIYILDNNVPKLYEKYQTTFVPVEIGLSNGPIKDYVQDIKRAEEIKKNYIDTNTTLNLPFNMNIIHSEEYFSYDEPVTTNSLEESAKQMIDLNNNYEVNNILAENPLEIKPQIIDLINAKSTVQDLVSLYNEIVQISGKEVADKYIPHFSAKKKQIVDAENSDLDLDKMTDDQVIALAKSYGQEYQDYLLEAFFLNQSEAETARNFLKCK